MGTDTMTRRRGSAYGGQAEADRLRRIHESAMPCTGCSHMQDGLLRTHRSHKGHECDEIIGGYPEPDYCGHKA